MVIDLKYFEQVFDEKTLRKGLRLFERSQVELNERPAHQSFLFMVEGFLLQVKKRGDKLLEYHCNCHKPKPCEHVSAVLFYFQQDTLGLKSKKQNAKSSNSKPSAYESCCATIQKQVQPYLSKEKLNQELILGLSETLSHFISRKSNKSVEQFIARLALVTEFSDILKARFSADESPLTALFQKTKEQLINYCTKKLNAEEFSLLQEAAYRSIKTNASLRSEAFCFLIPLLISHTKNKLLFDKLSISLSRRKHKQLYSEKLDKLLVVQLQVSLKLKEAEGASFKIATEPLELVIARAENLFSAGKTNKAFDWLESNYDLVKKEKREYFGTYTDYLIEKAKEKKKPTLEINYLKESFLRGLYVPQQALDRLLHLVPKKQHAGFLDSLIREMRSASGKNYFDKIVPLLRHQQKWKELLVELKQQREKFQLVHEASLNLLPEFSEESLNLYAKHFIETIGGTKPHLYQQKLFDTSKDYLNRLPDHVVEKFIEKILFTIGKNVPVYRYILAAGLHHPEPV